MTELKFVGGGKRFFAGALAGSSAIVLHAKLAEKATGKVIEPHARGDTCEP
jgi:hypothetical protein